MAAAADGFERKEAVVRGTLRRARTEDGVAWRYYIVDSRNERRYEVSQTSTVKLANYLNKPLRIEGRHRFSPLNGEHRLFPVKIGIDSGKSSAARTTESKTLLQVIDEGALPSFVQVSHQSVEELAPPPTDAAIVEDNMNVVVPAPAAGGGNCPHCGPNGFCGPEHLIWVRGEYLAWWLSGANTPPLVTTSPAGTARDDAGVLGRTGTTVLFGQEELHRDVRHGARISFGVWLDDCNRFGVEGDVFGFAESKEDYAASSNGSTILAQPFLKATTGQQAANLIAFPNLIAGSINIASRSDFTSAGARLRKNLICMANSQCTDCAEQSGGMRVDLVGGYRYINLDESLVMVERTNSLVTAMPAQFDIADSFSAKNEFHGGEIGLSLEVRRQRWWIELLTKLAFGNNRQTVTIDGNTVLTTGGIQIPMSGGIFAQRTNIGTYTSDDFLIIPEMGFTLGINLTKRLSITGGYNFMYLSDVVRPAAQIDTVLNPNLFPPEASPFSGPLRPQFSKTTEDLWAQGATVGIHYIW